MGESPDRYSRKILSWAPLLAMPLILNLRWQTLIAPNEEPKWLVLVMLGLVLSLAGAVELFLQCRRGKNSSTAGKRIGLTLQGILFALFFAGLALGVLYTVNPGEGFNRLAFWCAGGITLSATAWAARNEPTQTRSLQMTLTASALFLCLYFWYGFFVDFKNPEYDKFVQFSRIGHFNFTADVLMTLIPLLTWTVLTQHAIVLRLAAGFSLLTSGFMLMTSGSLGGMGGMAAGGLVAAALGLARRCLGGGRLAWRPGRQVLVTSAMAALLVVIAAKPVYERIPKEYREQIFVRAEWWDAPKAQDVDKARTLPPFTPFWMAILPYLGARTPMWASTSGMVAEHPWQGFGTGSYLFEYPGYSKRYDLFGDFETQGIRVKTNPHNILLQIASENGIPLTLLFVGLYLWLTLRVMRQAWREPAALWLCGVWALWAAGLDAQVNHVFFNPASLFMAAVALGLLYGRLPVSPSARKLALCPLYRWPVIPMVTGLASIALALYPLRWLASEYYVSEATRLESSHPPASSRHIRFTWEAAKDWSPTNPRAAYGLAMAYYNTDQLTDAEEYLREFLRLAPNHSPGLNLLASLYARLGRFDEAEATFAKALSLEPDATTVRENLEKIRKLKKKRQPSPERVP